MSAEEWTFDPKAPEWTFTWDGDTATRSFAKPVTRRRAVALASSCDRTCPDDARHRVVHISELAADS